MLVELRIGFELMAHGRGLVGLVLCVVFGLSATFAQTPPAAAPSPQSLKTLSIEELMDLEVTSVSRRPEKLSETAAAIQVITSEDIHRSGATTLPEVLRLASNLHVAQVNSSQWAISARGFNSTLANKMLVLIDGRSVYTPLHAGVFWDIQNLLLEDIERIEVISGSGATLWGANAVNGIISITTKHAEDTQGVLFETGGGSQPRSFLNARFGGRFGSSGHYRIYSQMFARKNTAFSDGRSANNQWHMGQGGFRLDWNKSRVNRLTVQGDFYDGQLNSLNDQDTDLKGGNILARWSREFSDRSDISLQFYYDRTHRSIHRSFGEDLTTYDLDFQHRLQLGDRNDLVWGFGYRQHHHDIRNTNTLAFLPPQVTRRRYGAFIQNEIDLIKDGLSVTAGTKIEHNDYTGFELQPSLRTTFKLDRRQMVWGAISRALRMPSRIDTELFIPAQPPFLLAGGPDFKAERALSYELGYRTHPHDKVSLTASTFYTDYTNLRSLEQVNAPRPFPIVIGNGLEGASYGVELTADYHISDRWRVRGGLTEMRIHIRPEATSTDRTNGSGESHDPNRHFILRSSLEPISRLQIDSTFRYVSEIANQRLPGYAELDLRLGWQPKRSLELSITGQNLLHDRHAEFGSPASRHEIARSVYGKVIWRFLQH
ncbi:MAG TPA: TonB-dependent receptor [Pyrinomonadaceae bacterium]|nr:TonB-dependent receptor [Pyrinomonadaceae bacterium]